jgi:S1-C subfamily serine protease
VLALLAAIVGAGIGAAVAQRGRSTSGPSDFALSPPTTRASEANGADAAIAALVDPAVVDVNTTLGFQNGATAGTGMVIGSSGEVLTNNHVVDGATSITAQINGTGPSYPVKVLGTDATDDVALLQIQGVSGLQTVKLGDSGKVAVGDRVVAIGNALGLRGPPSVSGGTVSALDQSITASDSEGGNSERLNGLIQIDAPLRPGDSGGPLVNTAAEVIGMNTAAAGAERPRSASTAAFAIPINSVMAIVHQIEAGRASSTVHIGDAAFLGVVIQSPKTSGGSVPATPGAVVAQVTPNTPADHAGLGAGDTIVAVDGKAINSPSDLTQRISDHHPGESAKIDWVDPSGKAHSATVRLVTGPTK